MAAGAASGSARPGAVARARTLDSSALSAGDSVGRYRILERVGAGGMGVVYAAYDPDLDRRVALKLLRSDRPGSRVSRARDRMVREARAMARLSHPNVITVHEVGEVDELVYVAMEFVVGRTLGHWLRERERGEAEILEAFRAAGAGLAHAHAAGIVHRDFKPDNVLVGDDGRVRVVDFGLARDTGDASAESWPGYTNPEAAGAREPLTEAGAVIGTLRYMAPEQLDGHRATARSDQFAFCVALWEALYGQRPFAGDTIAALSTAIRTADLTTPPDARVPGRVHAAMSKGLAHDSNARHPSLVALLAVLAPETRTRARWPLALGVGGIAAAAAAFLALGGETSATPPCARAGAPAERVWPADRRAAVEAALSGVDVPSAAVVASRVVGELDAHQARWVAQSTEACLDTRERGLLSEAVLDLRTACLADGLAQVDALAGRLMEVDRVSIHKAIGATAELPDPRRCADIDRLTAPIPPPEDAATLAAVKQVREALAGVRATKSLGDYKGALAVVEPLRARVAALGYRPLEAETLYHAADLLDWNGRSEEAAAVGHEAVLSARAAGHAEIEARGWALLVYVEGYPLRRYDAAERAAAHAEATLAHLGGNPLIEAEVANNLGAVREKQGRYREFAELQERAFELRRAHEGERSLLVALSHNNLGNAYRVLGELTRAVEHYERALALRTAILGEDHPEVAMTLFNVASLEKRLGRFDRALTHLDRARAIWARTLPDRHAHRRQADNERGSILLTARRSEEALAAYAAARAVAVEVAGEGSMEVIRADVNLGAAAQAVGDLDEAERRFRKAGDALERSRTKAPQTEGLLSSNLGDIERARGRHQAAVRLYRRAIELAGETAAQRNQVLPRLGLGASLRALGRPDESRRVLEEALALLEGASGEILAAQTRLELAETLVAAETEHARARELAAQARELYEALGERFTGERDRALFALQLADAALARPSPVAE